MMTPKLAIIIRGHERYTFDTPDFRNLLLLIAKALGGPQHVHLFIHTWQAAEASVSYRGLETTTRTIDEARIREYYADVGDIKSLMIYTDAEADDGMLGSKEGTLAHMPIIGWKRMWCGIYVATTAMMKAHLTEQYTSVLNVRCDILTVQKNNMLLPDAVLTPHNLLSLIGDGLSQAQDPQPFVKFLFHYPGTCIDNIYVGNAEGHKKLAENFWSQMDGVRELYNRPDIQQVWHPNHEKVVFFEASRLGLLKK